MMNNSDASHAHVSMYPLKVYLIRHAQSEENVLDLKAVTTATAFNEILRRSYAAPLTKEGELQAQAVVEKLAGAQIERLCSSPFTRTLSTASTLGNALGLTPHLIDDLREVLPNPIGEHRKSAPLRRLFFRSYLEMFWPWMDGETWVISYRRAKSAWRQVIQEPAKEIAVVSHRGLIGLILMSLRRDRHWRIVERDLSNGGVSIVVRRQPSPEQARESEVG